MTLKTLRSVRRFADERRGIPREHAFGESLRRLATKRGCWIGRTGAKDDDVVFRGDLFHDGDLDGVEEHKKQESVCGSRGDVMASKSWGGI